MHPYPPTLPGVEHVGCHAASTQHPASQLSQQVLQAFLGLLASGPPALRCSKARNLGTKVSLRVPEELLCPVNKAANRGG